MVYWLGVSETTDIFNALLPDVQESNWQGRGIDWVPSVHKSKFFPSYDIEFLYIGQGWTER